MCRALSFGFEGFGILELEFGIRLQNLGDIRGLRVEDLPGLGLVLGFLAARCPGAGSTASYFASSHGVTGVWRGPREQLYQVATYS